MLLKNTDDLLPLHVEAARSFAIIGRFAKFSRFLGAGSAHVNPIRIDNAYNELQHLLNGQLVYAEGYAEDGSLDRAILEEAVEASRAASVAIIFAGLTDKDEVEGFDRSQLALSEAHNRLIEEVCRVQPNTVVVLCNGSAITMPWIDAPKAVLETGLGGQASGGAAADVLLGRVNPSGKLAETFARRLEDTPAYLNYPGEANRVRYGEGLFVGYRYYDQKKIIPLFPFGHGLSYTTFEYTDVRLSQPTITDEENLEVMVRVRNTGTRAGKEVVQLYVRDPEASVVRPEKELKAFAKVALEPGEEQEVRLLLEPRDFAFYDSTLGSWRSETGEFEVLLGKSSAQIVLNARVTLTARPIMPVFSKWDPLKKFFTHPKAAEVLLGALASYSTGETDGADLETIFVLPLIKLASFSAISEEQIDALVEQVNQAVRSASN